MAWLWQSREGPRDIPQWAYLYLVTQLKVDSDQLTGLKCVERIDVQGNVVLNLIRIYNPAPEVRIRDFAALDEHPELIRYEGYRELEGERASIVRRTSSRASR